MSEPLTLTKVDSAVGGLSSSPPAKGLHEHHEHAEHDLASSPPKDRGHRRGSSRSSVSYPGVRNINELQEEGTELQLAIETQVTGWKINTSSATVEDKEILKKPLTTPPVRKIDLHFPLGLEVTARNMRGVTIKDALDAIHKAFKKRSDDELDAAYLKGFEWDKEESWTRLIVHLTTQPTGQIGGGGGGGGKKKKSKGSDE